jgi:AcrR family transcriptional regulator
MSSSSSSSASERLIHAATRLFYERGITASGVDAIVAGSGVSKPTLYAHFGTKHRLIAAVLNRQHQERQASLEGHLQARSTLSAAERLLSIFDWVAALQHSAWTRGCPFVNASVELVMAEDDAAKDIIRRHKRWFRGVLAALAEEAGTAACAVVASQLHLLIEGANARMLAEGDLTAITAAKQAAQTLLADTWRSRRGQRRSRCTR